MVCHATDGPPGPFMLGINGPPDHMYLDKLFPWSSPLLTLTVPLNLAKI